MFKNLKSRKSHRPKGFLIKTDGTVKVVRLPKDSEKGTEEMLSLINSEDLVLKLLYADQDSLRSLFLFTHIYNEFPERTTNQEVNMFFQKIFDERTDLFFKGKPFPPPKIYGDCILYLSEPQEENPDGGDTIYNLKITEDEFKFLMKHIEITFNMFGDEGDPAEIFAWPSPKVSNDPEIKKEFKRILAKAKIYTFDPNADSYDDVQEEISSE